MSSELAVGIDFGTSNSAVAIPGKTVGEPARVVAIDPAGDDQRLFRSVLFFPQYSRQTFAGAPAISQYISEGEGRFIQSVKSFLHSPSFERTQIRGRNWTIEDLVAAILRPIREKVEAEEGRSITRVVLGRPAAFSPNPELDRLAETRLLGAAERAGYPSPVLVIEPIAAALGYEATLNRDELVLVGDFGAGTSDFTLMNLGPGRSGHFDRKHDVVASAGVRVGGDRFDAAIVQHRLLSRFGGDSTYEVQGRRMPIPAWMTRKVLAWHELSLLRDPEVMAFLARTLETSDSKDGIQNLISLVEENLAYHLYRAVENTKRALSAADEAVISFHMSDIDLEERVTREDFDVWTAPLRNELMQTVDRVLDAAGGKTPDAVFLTGGSSKVPAVRAVFAERFGDEKLREGDAFTSVAAGLGRAALDYSSWSTIRPDAFNARTSK